MKSILTKNDSIGTAIEHSIAVGEALFSLGIDPLPLLKLPTSQLNTVHTISENLIADKVTYIHSFKETCVTPFTSTKQLIAHLIEVHRYLIKNKLPFIVHLIEKAPITNSWVKDLTLIFPLFVEDFIHHIFEEEETLFKYILQLDANDPSLLTKLPQQSISSHALEHLHDDELKGIKELTDNYSLPATSTNERIILSALTEFDTFLTHHAQIEDTILFPRALHLENQLFSLVKKTSILN